MHWSVHWSLQSVDTLVSTLTRTPVGALASTPVSTLVSTPVSTPVSALVTHRFSHSAWHPWQSVVSWTALWPNVPPVALLSHGPRQAVPAPVSLLPLAAGHTLQARSSGVTCHTSVNTVTCMSYRCHVSVIQTSCACHTAVKCMPYSCHIIHMSCVSMQLSHVCHITAACMTYRCHIYVSCIAIMCSS